MQTLLPRRTHLGELAVQRHLPQRDRRLVGAWCFLDAFGPLTFDVGKPMDVGPHPHIGIQTVTWLLAGEAMHRDSLDSEALARPGALNLMTSGHGIAHSEETPTRHSSVLQGIQLWIALPEQQRDAAPAFDHHADRPRVERAGWQSTVILGELDGVVAPARTFTPLVAAELSLDVGAVVEIPLHPEYEHALLPMGEGSSAEGTPLSVETLYYLEPGRAALGLRSAGAARLLLIGGTPFREPIVMWWNFVARTADEIKVARDDWAAGRRFGAVRYQGPRIEAPAFLGRPVAANPIS